MARVNFLILTTQRSGSTLLRTSLDSHPEIRCFGEIFLRDYAGDRSFSVHSRHVEERNFLALISRSQRVYRFLDEFFSDGGDGAIGFKFMYNLASYRPYNFPMVMDYARKKQVRVIHLIRENTLNSCLSRQFAESTRIYHAENVLEQIGVRINIPQLLKHMKLVETRKAKWRLKLNRFICLEVSYEEFVKKKDTVSSRILEFLDVNADVNLVSPLKRIRTASLADTVENYAELERAIFAAGYGRFLSSEPLLKTHPR